MAAINGSTGSVTYANGYVTSAYQWEISTSSDVIDTTPFSPSSSYKTRSAGILDWRGSYKCRKAGTSTTTIAGGGYVTNPYRYRLRLTAEILPITPFTSTYKTKTTGLLSGEGSWECYIDDTTALPAAGTTGTQVFTVTSGVTYTVPYVVSNVTVRTAADGSSRIVTCDFVSNGPVVLAGSPPAPATTGSATFVAYTGRQYAGTIFVSAVEVNQSADLSDGEYTIEFEGSGTLTPG